MPGSGELTLTGQLGEVMKESAQIAFNWLRSNSTKVSETNTWNCIPISLPWTHSSSYLCVCGPILCERQNFDLQNLSVRSALPFPLFPSPLPSPFFLPSPFILLPPLSLPSPLSLLPSPSTLSLSSPLSMGFSVTYQRRQICTFISLPGLSVKMDLLLEWPLVWLCALCTPVCV